MILQAKLHLRFASVICAPLHVCALTVLMQFCVHSVDEPELRHVHIARLLQKAMIVRCILRSLASFVSLVRVFPNTKGAFDIAEFRLEVKKVARIECIEAPIDASFRLDTDAFREARIADRMILPAF